MNAMQMLKELAELRNADIDWAAEARKAEKAKGFAARAAAAKRELEAA